MIYDDNERPADYIQGTTRTRGGTRTRTEDVELFADRYLIVQELGKGGMGRVFLATDTKMKIDVAIKTMRSVDPGRIGDVKRKNLFIREATIAASLHHANIVPIIGFDIASIGDPLTGAREEVPYIVMEYVKDGFTLAQELRERRKLSLDETIAVLAPIAEALDYAHVPYGTRKGIVHRDVKPDNIILQRVDGKLYARLLDFGISKPQSHGVDVKVTMSDRGGTRAYMAPERLMATCPPTVAQDVYSFAATAYECLVGEPPITDKGQDSEIYARLEKSWREGSLVCPYPESGFAKAVMKGLSLNPDDRPKSCRAFFGEEKGISQKAEGSDGFSGFTFTLDRDEFEWNGAELMPAVNVEPGGHLVEHRDFALEYENNKDVGEAKVAIVGKYRYRGCVEELSFRIVPRQMSKVSVADIQPCEYVGKQVFPAISVTDPDRGVGLEQGRDYLVNVLGNGMAGTAEVEIDGRGTYRGRVKKTFQILRRDISRATVTIPEDPEYNGRPVHPKVTIRDKELGRDLREDVDYSVECRGDVENEGRLTVTGMGNYDGTFGMPFVILPRDIVKAAVEIPQSVRFDGHPVSTLSVKVQDSELKQELKDGVDYRVECRNANGPGTGVACVIGIGRYRGEVTREFQICKGRFDVVDRLTARVEYDGKPHGIDVGVRDAPKGMKVLYSRSHDGPYAAEPIDIRDVCGEVRIWFRIECDGFESYSGFGMVEIRPKRLNGLMVRPIEDQLFAGGPVCPKVTVVDPDLGVELTAGRDFELQPSGGGGAGKSCVTVVGMGNYDGRIDCPFTILPKYISSAEVADIPEQVYDGRPKRPDVSLRDVELGRDLVPGQDYELEYVDENGPGHGAVRVIGRGNYRGVKPVVFKVLPRDMAKVEAMPIPPVRYEGHPVENVDVELRDVELGRALGRGIDYMLSFENASRPGTASVKIVGLGAYSGGSLRAVFKILEGEFAEPEVVGFSGEYDGRPHEISVKPVGAPPSACVVYSIYKNGPYEERSPSFWNVCNATTVWFRITCKGYRTFQGKATVEVRPRQLTRQTIDVGIEPLMAKEDVSACPVVKLVDKSLDKVLVLNTDYTLESRNSGRKGFGCVVIKGKGNYTGEIVEKFAFRQARGILAENVVFRWPYGMGEVSAIVRDSETGKFLKQGTDFRLEVWNDHPELGWMMAKVTGLGDYDGEIIGRHMKVDQRFESLLQCLSGLSYSMYKGDAYLVKLKADVEGRSIAFTDLLGGVTIDLNGFRIVSGKRPPFILAHDEDAMQGLGFVGDFPEVGMPLPEWKDCVTSLKIVNSRPGVNSGVYCDCDEVVSVSRGTSWMATFALDDSVVRRGGAP